MFARLSMICSVAVWEFRRFYKMRDQLLSLGLAIAGGAVGVGVQYLVGKAAGPVRVGIVGGWRLPRLQLPETSRLEIHNYPDGDEPILRDAVGSGVLDGLLTITGLDSAELLVSKEPLWERE